jgi:hypothetical protein
MFTTNIMFEDVFTVQRLGDNIMKIKSIILTLILILFANLAYGSGLGTARKMYQNGMEKMAWKVFYAHIDESTFDQAQKLFNAGARRMALEVLEHLVSSSDTKNTEKADAYFMLGQINFARDLPLIAVDNFHMTARLDPNKQEARVLAQLQELGLEALYSGNTRDAEFLLTEASYMMSKAEGAEFIKTAARQAMEVGNKKIVDEGLENVQIYYYLAMFFDEFLASEIYTKMMNFADQAADSDCFDLYSYSRYINAAKNTRSHKAGQRLLRIASQGIKDKTLSEATALDHIALGEAMASIELSSVGPNF